EFLQALPLTCNNSIQFDCRTLADPQGCIPLEWLCDGLKDCKNGLDESRCSYLHSCPEGNFICRSGDCVSGRYKCDGEADCPGGEDESGCKNHETFLPGASSIRKTFKGFQDCPLREDEHNCTGSSTNISVKVTSCDVGMVLCADNTACFPKHWVCDGEADCLDGSDEVSVYPNKREYSARKCIPLNHTCNGVRDCPNGDDEGARCNECQSRRTPCEFECINTPQGSRCICPHGSVLNADEFSCTPKDECLTTEGKQCEQYCEDLHNSFVFPLFKIDRKASYPPDFVEAISVNGLLRVVRENIVGMGQVAVDWIGGNFYFTQRYPSRTPGISVCSQDGFFFIAKRKYLSGKRRIALHPQRGTMVWIESFNRHRIMMADMDGENVRVLVENKLDYPTGISIDLIRGDVYFGDVEREMIERVNMDTRERTVVLTKGVHHPYDLKYFNGFLYWSDWASSSLKVAELRLHHESAYLIHSFAGLPYGLAINHSIYQPTTSSIPCALNDCQWMCVSIPNIEGELEAKCLCPDGYDRSANGDCLPLSDPTTTDPDGSSLKDEGDLSHVGVAWMKERCDDGDGCLNGGQCKDIKNEHGRVTKIICKCETPYEGYRCERLNPIKERAEQLAGSSRPHWLALFTFMLLILLVLIFIFSYLKMLTLSSFSTSRTTVDVFFPTKPYNSSLSIEPVTYLIFKVQLASEILSNHHCLAHSLTLP
ncbi:unnamed protein product, partial [Angiostrongylus costaricensis]|uniref:EGF-like domain-containing protein n=1 Tax=Angiostrongylus costaricensis TaxID=334426 RepID=A0A158PH93_ANGCS